jgi:FkbM family methyltransferase
MPSALPPARSSASDGAPGHFFRTVSLGSDIRYDVAIGAEADDPISVQLAEGGIAPSPLTDLLLPLFQPGQRVLDLGAHIGTFSLAAAARNCQVLAVEASPRNAALLQESAVRNRFANLRVVNVAVSDRPGTVDFCPYGPFGHVRTTLMNLNLSSIPVRAIPVDALLGEVGWDTVDLIKMDVEGSEIAALRGMKHLLTRGKAPLLVYECNAATLRFYGQTPRQLKEAVEEFGYRSYQIEPKCQLRQNRVRDLQPEICIDCLALKERPAGLTGWEIVPRLSRAERIERVLASCIDPNPWARAHAVRILSSAPAWLFHEPIVRKALARLAKDSHEEVQTFAASAANRKVRLALKYRLFYGLRRYALDPLRRVGRAVKRRLKLGA